MEGSGGGHGAGGVSGNVADDAGPQPVGSGGHLWGDGGLEGAQGQRSGRQSPSRDRALVSRPGDHRSERARGDQMGAGYRLVVTPEGARAVPRPVSLRRSAQSGSRARDPVRDGGTEERRGGEECGLQGKTRGSSVNQKKKKTK